MSQNTVQNIPHSEEEKKPEKSFSVDILPIADKEDKMEFLSNLSIVNDISKWNLNNLWFSQHTNSADHFYTPSNWYHVFLENLKSIWIDLSANSLFQCSKIKNIWIYFFKAKSVSELWNNIFITTTDNQCFYGNFDEYIQNGLSALSIVKDTKANAIEIKIKQTETYIHQKWLLKIKAQNKFHSIAADSYCVSDPGKNQIAVLKDNQLKYYTYNNQSCSPETQVYDLSDYGDVKEISTDNNNNFYFIVTHQDDKNQLRILNRNTLAEINEPYEWIKEILYMSHVTGQLFCIDNNGYLRVIIIATNDLERGFVDNNTLTLKDNSTKIVKIQDTTTYELKKVLESGWVSLDINMVDDENASEPIKAEIISFIWELNVWDDTTLKEKFDNAESIEEIEQVRQLFLQVQQHPQVMSVPGITDSMESVINKKRFSILLNEVTSQVGILFSDFERIQKQQNIQDEFPQLLRLQTKLHDVKKQRSQIPNVDTSLDTNISELSNKINTTITDIRTKNASQVKAWLDSYLDKIETYLSAINYLPQITSIYSTDIYNETLSIIDFFDWEDKKKQTTNLENIIQSHINRVERSHKSQDDEKQNQISEKLDELRNSIHQVQRVIASIEDESTLNSLTSSDPLVLKIREDITLLPKAEGDILKISLENIFLERNREIRMSKLYTQWVSVSLDEYGIDTSLYYADKWIKHVWFKLEWARTQQWNIRLELHYDDGTIFNIDSYLQDPWKYAEGMIFTDIPTELSQEDFLKHQKEYSLWLKSGKKELSNIRKQLSTIRWDVSKQEQYTSLKDKLRQHLEKYKSARILDYFATTLANKLDLNPRSHLSLPDPRFIVLAEEKDIFRKMSAGFSIQKQERKWIEILEGDPGLWKTMMCEEFGAITNREVIRIQCSKMDPSDLFFSPQLKAGETSRQPAEWIKIMQKPGTLILFDEVDKLDPQCFERLHRLFDAGRSIYDPQIWTIKAHPDCLFAGTRNSYEILSNPIVSRSSIMQIHAPSEENEAYKIAKYTWIDYFNNVSFKEFVDVYEGRNDDTKSAGSEKLTSILDNIRSTVQLFQKLRKKQKSDNYDDKFEFEVSYRDAEQIFLRHRQLSDSSFKDIAKEVLTPKARAVVKDFEDKDIQEKILNDLINSCFN